MNALMSWLEGSFAPSMKRFGAIPWVNAVSSAMMKAVPFILIGSLVFLYQVFMGWFPWFPDIWPVAQYTFQLLGVIVAFLIGQQCMEKLGHNDYVTTCGIISISMLFMFVLPGSDADGNMVIIGGRLGAAGTLVGIIAGLYTAIIFNLWAKWDPFRESELPDFLLGWINAILPSLVCLLVGMVLTAYLGLDVFNLILAAFSPLQGFAQTLPGMICLCFIPALFFCCGVSSWMFSSISTPIYLAAINENISLVASGMAPANYTTNEAIFASTLIMMGGIGATLALNVLMLFSKSRSVKAMGRIFITTSAFNINEPIIYGAPIVLNPILMIPYLLNMIVGPVLLWGVFSFGLLNVPSTLLQVNNIPIGVATVMATQDWRGVIWAAVFFLVYLAIWYPFFKVYEKDKLEEEGKIVEASERQA